ncbi:MAG: hypothetical protein FWC89_08915 [Defluviitaleaceae bacterium]|nr:hypothetical protein [Defluviitaleaceae bacterium]
MPYIVIAEEAADPADTSSAWLNMPETMPFLKNLQAKAHLTKPDDCFYTATA